MKRWMLLLLALTLCVAVTVPAAADEFRPLPIDLSGGAPVKTRYSPQLTVYEDPTIRVERVREESKEWGFTYYLATITIKDASQLRTASADNTFTSSAKVPATTMARRNNAVLAVDGDFCASFSGNMANNYILRQGTVFRDTVSRVTVQAKTQAGNTVLRVTYDREKLLHKNFAFMDPVAFTESCGATWQE